MAINWNSPNLPQSQVEAFNAAGGIPDTQTYDRTSLALANAYKQLASDTQMSAGSLPDAARKQVDQYLSQIVPYVGVAERLPAILGAPKYDEIHDPVGVVKLVRVAVKMDAFQQRAMDAKADQVRQLSELGGQADGIIEACFAAAAVPSQPRSASEMAIQDRKNDVVGILESATNGASGKMLAARELVRQAINEDDRLTLYVVCGAPCKFVRQRFGLNDVDLLKFAFQQQIQANAGVLPTSFGSANPPIPGAAFLQRQLDPATALTAVVPAALAFMNYQYTYTRALLIG